MGRIAVSVCLALGLPVIASAQAPAAPAHAGNTELHYIIEGSGTIVTGGTITYLEVRWLVPPK